MKRKLSLLEQALIEDKRQQLEKISNIKKNLSPLERLKSLLPNFEPSDKQSLFLNSTARECGIKGGYGAGKTIAFCAKAIELAELNKPYPLLLVSPSYDNALSTVFESLKQLCSENYLEYDWQVSTGIFQIIFGMSKKDRANIWLAGGDSPKFLKGMNLCGVGLDEPFVQKKETQEVAISRIREPKAKRQCFFWSGTPEPEKMEWGYEYFEKDTDDKDLFTITIPTYDNKHLTKAYINQLEGKFDARMREAYMLGKYVNLSAGKVYESFDREKNVIPTLEIKPSQIIISFDFNISPMTAVAIAVQGKQRIQFKEWKLNSSNTGELAEVITEYFKDYKGVSFVITGDASGRKKTSSSMGLSDYAIIRSVFDNSGLMFSIYVAEANPLVRDRVNYVNSLFEKGWFLISNECKESIRDRELVTWKQTAEGFKLDKSKKDLTHLSDAADYGIWLTRRMGIDEENKMPMIIAGRRRERRY